MDEMGDAADVVRVPVEGETIEHASRKGAYIGSVAKGMIINYYVLGSNHLLQLLITLHQQHPSFHGLRSEVDILSPSF